MCDALDGRDILGQGRTGSGKTLAFAVPTVMSVADGQPTVAMRPSALVISPTRELARQIEDVMSPLASAAGVSVSTVFGGVPHAPQRRALLDGVDMLVACPGRLLDLVSEGSLVLDLVSVCVVDEADMMLEQGFLPQVRRILDMLPSAGQRMLFSATLGAEVLSVAGAYLKDPVSHFAAHDRPAQVTHRIVRVSSDTERARMVVELCVSGSTVVFCRTKRRARALSRSIAGMGVSSVELHGNLSQAARTRNLSAFADGTARVMVATDIAARGTHVGDVALVVHADPPAASTSYIHRSGRTARAGASGEVVTLATVEQMPDVARMLSRLGIDSGAGSGRDTQEAAAPRRRARTGAAERARRRRGIDPGS